VSPDGIGDGSVDQPARPHDGCEADGRRLVPSPTLPPRCAGSHCRGGAVRDCALDVADRGAQLRNRLVETNSDVGNHHSLGRDALDAITVLKGWITKSCRSRAMHSAHTSIPPPMQLTLGIARVGAGRDDAFSSARVPPGMPAWEMLGSGSCLMASSGQPGRRDARQRAERVTPCDARPSHCRRSSQPPVDDP
jgi:hypothetical protein